MSARNEANQCSGEASQREGRYRYEIDLDPKPPLDIELAAMSNIDLAELAELADLEFELTWSNKKTLCSAFPTHTGWGHWPMTVFRDLCPFCEATLKEVLRKGHDVGLHIHENGPMSEERRGELIQELKSKPATLVGYRYQASYAPVVHWDYQATQSGVQPYKPVASAAAPSTTQTTTDAGPAPYTVMRGGEVVANVPAPLIEEAAVSCPALAEALWGAEKR